jgi:hypothetical protein
LTRAVRCSFDVLLTFDIDLMPSQAICSFVPAQIDFSSLVDTNPFGRNLSLQRAEDPSMPRISAAEPTSAPTGMPRQLSYDAVLFFHGLNGLELACENGKVPPGTCTLFNGASMLLDANADKLSGQFPIREYL